MLLERIQYPLCDCHGLLFNVLNAFVVYRALRKWLCRLIVAWDLRELLNDALLVFVKLWLVVTVVF